MDSQVTQFIDQLRQGDDDAAAAIWQHFHTRLVHLARKKLQSRVRRVVDEEDVVVSAFESCFRAVRDGRTPDLHDSDNLWALLATITERKAYNANRDQMRQKRGGGGVLGESVFLNPNGNSGMGIAGIPNATEPTPEFAALMADECERRLAELDGEQRRIAQFKLEGYLNREIADELDCSVAKVERKLKLIREKWEVGG